MDANNSEHLKRATSVTLEELVDGRKLVSVEMDELVSALCGSMCNYTIQHSSLCDLMMSTSEKPKVLRYKLDNLIKVGGLMTFAAQGTVFTMNNSLPKNIVCMCLVSLFTGTALWLTTEAEALGAYDLKPLEDLVKHINGFVPFVLAFYVALTLTRWWNLRINALGKIFEGLANVCLILSIVLPGARWRPVRIQVMKYGMASIGLVVQAARSREHPPDLVKFIEDGLLTELEISLLEDVAFYQRAMMMWSWIGRVTEAGIKKGGVQAARQNVILGKIMQARDGINTIHTYLDTQLPFPYVHLITFIVNVQNLVLAAKCGASFVVAYVRGSTEILVYEVITVVLVGSVYQGLLSIASVVQDPFGDDLLDFAIMYYIRYVSRSCMVTERAQYNCPAMKRLDLLEEEEIDAMDVKLSL